MRSARGYNAFISYSHRHDGLLGPALQIGLERFAKPWYGLRGLRVFRDSANLAASPDLWRSIEQALSSSAWFVLLASADAAKSAPVDREVRWWTSHRQVDRMIVVGTERGLAWDSGLSDWAVDAPVPSALRGVFAAEPLWVDLADIRLTDRRDRIPDDRLATIAAAIRGAERVALIGEHLRQHRRVMRLARSAVAALATLTALALAASFIAIGQRETAIRQRDAALSGEFIVESEAEASANPLLARIDSLAAWRLHPSAQSRHAMLAAAALPGIVTLTSAQNVTSVAYTADSRTLAVKNGTGSVQFWNADDYQPAPGIRDRLHATITVTGVIQLWHSNTYRQVVNARHHEILKHLKPVAFSPDGAIIITVNSLGRVQARIASTGRKIADIRYSGYPSCLSAPSAAASKAPPTSSGTGRTHGHAGRSDPGISAHDNPSSPIRIVTTSPGPPTTGYQPPSECVELPNGRAVPAVGFGPLAMAISPRGRVLALITSNGLVQLWNLTSPRPRPTAIRVRGADELAFSPDGEQLAIGADSGSVELWSLRLRKHADPVLHAASSVDALAFGPAGATLAAGTDSGAIDIWNTATGQMTGTPLQAGSPVSSVAFAPDGRTLASADGQAQIWTVPSQARTDLGQNLYYARSMTFSPARNILAIELGTGVQVLNVISRRLTTILTGTDINGLALSPDSAYLAITSPGPVAQLINITTNHRSRIPDRYGISSPLPLINSSDTILATSDLNGMITLDNLRARQSKNIRTGYGFYASAGAFIDNDAALALAYGTIDGPGPVQLINLETGRRRILMNNDQIMTTNTSGTMLATADGSNIVRVWNTSSLKPGPSFYGGDVAELALSPDGTILAVGHPDGAIQLWDASTGERIGEPFQYTDYLTFLAFAENSKILVAGGSGGNVRTWKIPYLPDVPASICKDIKRPLAEEKTHTTPQQIDSEYCTA